MTPSERARVEQLARLLADFLRYDWNGLHEHSTVARGFPVWSGLRWQGGRDDLRAVAAFMLGQMDEPAERAAYRRGIEDALEAVQGLRPCPFDKGQPDPGVAPDEPCPVCGDFGDDLDAESNCCSPVAAIRALLPQEPDK